VAGSSAAKRRRRASASSLRENAASRRSRRLFMVVARRPISSPLRATGRRLPRSPSGMPRAALVTASTGLEAAPASKYAPPTERRKAARAAPTSTFVRVPTACSADS